MSRISAVLAVPAAGAYFYTDLAALQDDPIPLADQYTAHPVTPGFRRVREAAEAVSVGLVLHPSAKSSSHPDDPRIAWGDCVSVAYGGAAGREPVFRTAAGLRSIRDVVAPALQGRDVTSFRQSVARIETLTEIAQVPAAQPDDSPLSTVYPGKRLSRRDLLTAPLRFLTNGEGEGGHPKDETSSLVKMVQVERPLSAAVRYGVSQALLKAAALSSGRTMAEVIAAEWDLPQPTRLVPVHAQSGPHRRTNAEKMIVRRVASLPHGLIEHIPEQLGTDGEALVRYVRWLKVRVVELGGADYRPIIHLDLHGALGRLYHNNLGRILGYIHRLESHARPYTLRLESPVVMETRAAQIENLGTLREYLRFRKLRVEIVADEWANTFDDIQAFTSAEAADVIQIKMPNLGGVHNTVEAVLACQGAGVGTLLGGSCVETDLSARVSAHVALATQPDLVMAKPGMGVDEGISIVHNEMARTLAWISLRKPPTG